MFLYVFVNIRPTLTRYL